MGLWLELKREFLRCISPNSLKTFRNGFIGQNRTCPASLSMAAGQQRPKIRRFWQKSSLPGVLLSPASRLLSVISVLDDSRQRQQHTHRDGKRFIVRAHEKLTEFIRSAGRMQCHACPENVKKRSWSLGWVLSGATRVSPKIFFSLSLRGPTQSNETIL